MGNSRQESNTEDDLNKIVKWNWETILMLVIAFVFIIVSFFAPLIFTSDASSKRYNFTTTGQIGDTIGGLMNPFISIAGVLLTFLAFYLQFKSNQLQFRLYFESRRNDEQIKEKEKEVLLYDNFELLLIDFEGFVNDFKMRLKYILEFTKYNKQEIFSIHPIKRIGNYQVENLFTNDRKLVFQFLKKHSGEGKEWLTLFNELYSFLNTIPAVIDEIYLRSDKVVDESYAFFENTPDKIHKCYQDICIYYNANRSKENYDNILDCYENFMNSYRQIIPETLSLKGNNHFLKLGELCSNTHTVLTANNLDGNIEINDLVKRLNRISADINMTANRIMKFKESIKADVQLNLDADESIERKLNYLLNSLKMYK